MLEVELVALPFVVLACAQHSKVGSGIARRQHDNDSCAKSLIAKQLSLWQLT